MNIAKKVSVDYPSEIRSRVLLETAEQGDRRIVDPNIYSPKGFYG
jgi:hypothetical protein